MNDFRLIEGTSNEHLVAIFSLGHLPKSGVDLEYGISREMKWKKTEPGSAYLDSRKRKKNRNDGSRQEKRNHPAMDAKSSKDTGQSIVSGQWYSWES